MKYVMKKVTIIGMALSLGLTSAAHASDATSLLKEAAALKRKITKTLLDSGATLQKIQVKQVANASVTGSFKAAKALSFGKASATVRGEYNSQEYSDEAQTEGYVFSNITVINDNAQNFLKESERFVSTYSDHQPSEMIEKLSGYFAPHKEQTEVLHEVKNYIDKLNQTLDEAEITLDTDSIAYKKLQSLALWAKNTTIEAKTLTLKPKYVFFEIKSYGFLDLWPGRWIQANFHDGNGLNPIRTFVHDTFTICNEGDGYTYGQELLTQEILKRNSLR